MLRARTAPVLSLALLAFGCSNSGPSAVDPVAAASNTDVQGFDYPVSKKVEQVDNYHGVAVKDPYRWLEDLDSDDTRQWIEAQNQVTHAYLEGIPQRDALRGRLTQLWDYERYGTPFKEGGKYFLFKNDGLQNQSVLYVMDKLDGEPRVLLDPNTLSADGTVALSGLSVSRDGKHLAFGTSASGSDWQTWHVRDIATGKDLTDELKWIKFSGAAWTADGKGFFYSRYDEPDPNNKFEDVNYFQKLYYHKVGTDQSKDTLIYERPDQKKWGFDGDVTDDGKYLVISIRVGTDPKNAVFFQKLKKGKPVGKPTELLPKFDAKYSFIDNDGPMFWFKTDLGAPRGRVVAIDTRKPQADKWKELIPQGSETLGGVSVVGDRFIANYMKDAYTQVRIHTLDGKLERQLELPGIGSAGGFGGKRDSVETFYSYGDFTQPGATYRLDVKSGKSEVFRQPKLAFDPSAFETKQVFYTSKDGTKVPMFIVHKKGLELDGNNPTYLYGYGGFNISLTPRFSPANIAWLELGGVYAQPNLRGGGEYGEEWHQAGTKLNKQNVFDDFIGAAEWLIANKYTSNQKLAIGGRSNGGLLVGAAMTQRPDLFRAALPGVGVLDMLRFHQFTIGWAWVSDYGSSENADEFKALFAYSPYHNVKPGTQYPATLVHTADHDDRVVPSHSFKFTAALQEAHAGQNPVMIRVETKAGHGAGKPTTKRIEEWVDLWGFLVKNLEVDAASLPNAQG